MHTTENLKVYKASAGSGKTFTLTVEYIKLLIENPDNYRHTLAVTFTNKATSEMKERIVSTLDKLARKDPSADGYLKAIGGDKEMVATNSKIALEKILHDYSRFRIETIDSFFQSIIRDLAHELGLTANLKVDLDQQSVLHDAVNLIIEDMENKTDALFYAVKDYIEDNIDSGKNWKINDAVENFAANIFKEAYLNNEKKISEAFKDDGMIKELKEALKTKEEDCASQCAEYGNRFMKKVETQEFGVDDFKKKSKGIYPFFQKLSTGEMPNVTNTILDFCEDGSTLFSNSKNEIYADEYRQLLNETVDYVEQAVKTKNSCELMRQHLNQMRLLSAVNDRVRLLNNEANRFLLAETAHFLNNMIEGSDIPFIYEKSGNRFDHIMIDEFQDTSTLQWDNFTPLLRNSLDAFNTCLIVGDVKQSIYRWRNSDWTILNEIKDNKDFKDDIDIKTLDTNYRSAENVIRFNNTFFKTLRSTCGDDEALEAIRIAYGDVEQKVAEKNKGKGYVEIEFVDADNGDYTENMLMEIEQTINRLLDKGVRQNDIAILARANSSLSKICNYFAEKNSNINIVSNDALELGASTSAQIIIAAMKVIAHPNDKLAVATLVHLIIKGKENGKIYIDDIDTLKERLPEGFRNHIEELAMMPVYELARLLFSIFRLEENKGQDAYMFCFFDELFNFIKDETTDIDKVLEQWNKVMCTKCIPGGTQDGVQAMTIHKSKGLEFHSVICPFFDWKIKASNLLWCEPKEKPYDMLPLTAIEAQSKTKNSIFEKEYDEEEAKAYADIMNLIYVAFTRAENNLFVLTKDLEKKEREEKTISAASIVRDTVKVMAAVSGEDDCQLTTINPRSPENEEGKDESEEATARHATNICTLGEMVEGKEKKEEDEENVCRLIFKSESPLAGFRQSNKALDFANTDDESENDRLKYINEGLIMHSIMEIIETPDDLDKALTQLESDGLIANKSYKEDVRQMFVNAMENEGVKDWFDKRWKVMNECTILDKDRNGKVRTHRPDRVIYDDQETIVIDYKTGKQEKRHIKQVKRYMDLLKEMGHVNVSGKIWYMQLGTIEDVETSLSGTTTKD